MRRLDLSSSSKNAKNTKPSNATTASTVSTRSKSSRLSIASAPAVTPSTYAAHASSTRTTRRILVTTPSVRSPRQPPTPTLPPTRALTVTARAVAPRLTPKVTLTQPQPQLQPQHSQHSQHSSHSVSARPCASIRLRRTTTNNTSNTSTTASTTASTTSTAATGQPSRPGASRAPLRSQHQKQHVTSQTVKTRSSPASVPNMPVGDRPRQPQLSAAAARSINRTPLTPKIAAKGPPVTPLARRPQSSTPTLANTQTARDDISTPVAAFLAHNITPRSGPRQIRVDSANSTPSGTPNPERTSDSFENINNTNHANRLGLGLSALAGDVPRQTASQVDLTSDSNDSSKFFYASDAKSIQQVGLQRPASVPQKSANTFFYANGTTADGSRNISPPSQSISTPPVNPNPESAASKFFYANGTPDMSLRPGMIHSASASAVSINCRTGPPRPPTSNSNAGFGIPAQRPTSPIKSVSTPMAQVARSNAASPTSPKRTSLVSSPPSLPQPAPSAAQRRVSIDTAPREMGGHKRTGSVPGVHSFTVPQLALSPNISEAASVSPPLSPGLSHPAMTMASILQAADELEDDESRDGDAQSEVPQVPQSPSKSAHFGDSVSELVANARRERKVQDLEITNASLEAINRTLERQLRKQTAELRRYRRLSRSGALSAASSRVTSLALTEPPTDMSDVDEEDETELEEEELDSFDDSDLSSNDTMSTEDVMFPSAKLEVRRRRDEKRLQLDLTKHQELLIDSQKMNQSLKRCMDFTEALIKEGQRALEYHVRVSDIQLGGRVLAPPDDEDEVSYQEEETIRSDDPGLEPPWPKSSQDRDSGIELPTDSS